MSQPSPGHGSGRASTRRGHPSRRPPDRYEPPPAVETTGGELVVEFTGRDGRRRRFDFTELPTPGMRAELAAAFAVRVGHTGTLHTLTSAINAWSALKRFAAFLARLPTPPSAVGEITDTQLRRFRLDRLATSSEIAVMAEMRRVCRVLMEIPAERIQPDTRAWLRTAQITVGEHTGHEGVPGYTDELFTQIMRAARSDVAAIRDRIRASERFLAAASSGAELDPQQRRLAAELAERAVTGEVPMIRFPTGAPDPQARLADARRLFLVSTDLAPLIVLGVGLSGRNGETIKELPAAHQLLDDRAVQLQVVKRRRGAGHWYADVVWEIGPPSRQLHTPGGFYLLLLELTARSRAISGSTTVWSLWLNGSVREAFDGAGHADPFARTLARDLRLSHWARRHGLTENGAPAGADPQPAQDHRGTAHHPNGRRAPTFGGAHQHPGRAVHQLPRRRPDGARLGRRAGCRSRA